ncbi:hypothetical protein SVIOM342S_09935 [Streptomyces violaceorubidus]
MRIVTEWSPAGVEAQVALDAAGGAVAHGLSNTPYTKRRVAPVELPDLTSEYPVKVPFSLSSVSPAWSVTLSKSTLASSPG